MAEAVATISGWERSLMAAEKVKERLRRATAALDAAGVPYAVVGGNAVAEWVGRVDEDAVRNTRDVDLLLRRTDLSAARVALEAVGFIYEHLLDGDMFIDGPQGRPSGGVHILFANEKVRAYEPHPSPDLDMSERGAEFQVISLEALAHMKLMAWRDKDRMHLRDLIDVGLIDTTWLTRLPSPLSDRLQELFDDPKG